MFAEPEILKYFKYDHLPERLQGISRPFGDMAVWMVENLPDCAQKAEGLQRLLEAKDCAVRAALP